MAPETPAETFDRDYDDSAETTDDGARMSFLEHLEELRKRIIYSLYAIGAACAVMFSVHTQMYNYLTGYLQEQGGTLIFTQPMGGFMFDLKVTVLAGVVLAAPFVFSQVWLFVAPGLYARERRVVIPFVLFASVLFFSGAYLAH
ncbi:MAG TPA: twin-arginine translocase subunit TatC, partial [Vicinamibacterales bacterium]|nr:twin-arginine translocase subunit TatC [Vicinamibacterales bacterium]